MLQECLSACKAPPTRAARVVICSPLAAASPQALALASLSVGLQDDASFDHRFRYGLFRCRLLSPSLVQTVADHLGELLQLPGCVSVAACFQALWTEAKCRLPSEGKTCLRR